jgi:hypothetical protein
MTIELLFDFVQKLVFVLGVAALALAFMYMYSAETDKRVE